MKLLSGKDLGLAGLALLMTASLVPEALAQARTQAPLEDPREILAVRMRAQGYTCIKPLKAVRDPQFSAPDVPAWILTCENGVFRLILHADMADQITQLQ